jgi:hypothetical protein
MAQRSRLKVDLHHIIGTLPAIGKTTPQMLQRGAGSQQCRGLPTVVM